MDEASVFIPSEGSSKLSRLRTASLVSRSSAHSIVSQLQNRPPRLGSPLLQRNHQSAASIFSNESDTDRSEIFAPVPRRHHILQTTESRHWLDTPPSPSLSSRPVSPLSVAATSPLSVRRKSAQNFGKQDTRHTSHRPLPRTGTEAKTDGEAGIAKLWVRWMHKQPFKHWVVPSAILASTLVKWCIGLGSFSGQGTPPMFGDYEAQRHWMELTIHLPFRQWYTYDLQYWGLDYPPLTAYVSWLCGILGSWINPTWFALDKSRGLEQAGSVVFMRSTVLILDALVYVPAVFTFISAWQGTRSSRTQHLALLILLFQPAPLLIDFGHFQYNSVMLGFTLLAMNFFATGQDLLGAFCFVLSLGFKQMALYYAPAIGSYLLAKCIYLGPAEGSKLFVRLGAVTVSSFLLLFLPFLPPLAPLRTVFDPLTRIFPFSRGLFEDKVANFWCATNVVFKWRLWAAPGTLVQLSTALTFLGFLPAVAVVLHSGWKLRAKSVSRTSTPLLPLLPYALLTSSMSFFLFSFQVHEKTILVPLLPLSLLLSGAAPDSSSFELGVLANNVAMFSMWPLLKRDGLGVQYIAMLLLWNRLIGHNPFRIRPSSLLRCFSMLVYAACGVSHILEFLLAPPSHLPDLYPVLNVLISTPVFALTWLWSIKRGIEVAWALGGLGGTNHAAEGVKKKTDGNARPNGEDAAARGTASRSLGYSQAKRRQLGRAASVGVDTQ